MTTRSSLLRALLLTAATTPAIGCGGKTDSTTGETSAQGTGGAAGSGGGGQAGSAARTGGTGGSGQSGTGGQGGSEAGTGGVGGNTCSSSDCTGMACGTDCYLVNPSSCVAGVAVGKCNGLGSCVTSEPVDCGTGGSAGASSKWPCVSPTPLTVGGKPTGYETCADGSLRRREVVECPSLLPHTTTCGDSTTGVCKTDSDCTEKPNGYCHPLEFQGGDTNDYCGCTYGCTKDSDCGAESICECGDPVGHCVQAACRSNADCGAGDCANQGRDESCSIYGFACLTQADACGGPADCAQSQVGTACVIKASSRECGNPMTCAIGRPLLVEQGWRYAALVAGAGWG